jgi:hypothetical protein
MSKSQSHFRPRLIRAGIATAAATAAVTAATISPAFAAATTVSLSSATGPSGATANTITLTASAATSWLAGVTAPITTYSLPACQTTYNTTASTAVTPSSASVGNVLQAGATDTTKISNTKAALSLPSLPLSSLTATSTKYNVCIYASSTSGDPLIGTATYSVAAAATLASSNTISPASGPALGGSVVTVTGTGFPTAAGSITATLGGTPMTNITPISSTSFMATTPYHPAGAVAIAVAGTVSKQTVFTYANGLVISPNTASNVTATSIAPVYVDVNGSNFLGMTFATTYTDGTSPAIGAAASAEVFLVNGAYEVTYAIHGPTARCGSVVVISDSELICSMNLHTGALTTTTGAAAGSAVPNGTYTLTVVSDGAINAVSPSITDISSGSTFTVANY